MKYLKPYSEQSKLHNESIRHLLKPNSDDDKLKIIDSLSNNSEKFISACKSGILSKVEETINNYINELNDRLNNKNNPKYNNSKLNKLATLVNNMTSLTKDDINLYIMILLKKGLFEACYNGHSNIVKYLINNFDIDPTFDDNICIKAAAEDANDAEIVRILLKDDRVKKTLPDNKLIPYMKFVIDSI